MALTRNAILLRAIALFPAFCGVFAPGAAALEGGQKAPHGRFAVVGSFAPTRSALGSGFSGVQIAPKWALTAAHAAPAVGAIFVDDCGMSGVAEVLTFPFKVPSQTPVAGALRDDLALVRLAAPIECPYFPQLADDTALPGPGPLTAAANTGIVTTLVSNNPSIAARRFGVAQFQGVYRAPGFDFLVVASGTVALVVGDSGSPLFLGKQNDTNGASILAGVATAQARTSGGVSLGIYTRVGPYRGLLDAAVQASGEKLHWYGGQPKSTLSSKDGRN
jgi:hypothetical protein